MREQIQQIIGELNEVLQQSENDTVKALCVTLVMRLEAAIRPQWVPVAERLPKRNRVVFVICKDSECRIAYHAGSGNWKDDGGWIVHVNVTHWHKIEYPEPPEANP